MARAVANLGLWKSAHDDVAFHGLPTLHSPCLTASAPVGLWPLVHRLPGQNFIRVPSRFTVSPRSASPGS